MSKAELMGDSPSQVGCSGSYSCQQQSKPEEPLECDAACESIGISEQKQLGSETIQSEPDDSECKHGTSEALQSCSLTENLDPPPEDASNSSLLNEISNPKPNSNDEKFGCVSENTNSQPCVENENVSPSKGKNLLGSGVIQNDIALVTVNGTLQSPPEGATVNCVTEGSELPHEDAGKSILTNTSSCTQHSTSERVLRFPSGALCEQSEEQPKTSQELVQDESVKISTAIDSSLATGNLEESHVVADKSSVKQLGVSSDSEANIPSAERLGPDTHEIYENRNLKKSESLSKDEAGSSDRLGSWDKSTKSSRRKYKLLMNSDRVLRSRSQEKPQAPESSANVVNDISIEKAKKKRRNKQHKRIEVDEYSKIKARLRYLLSKICYEQSLITAYSSDGWKGISLEKVKPEKELQRATSEILRRKLEIRNLFQRIDSLCAEGRFSESLFDSEGLISSEDIFCAKCGSKDLATNNDIILCDGACDRGFHQFCLVPPLLTEDIPPDDEGWLCPGCDCKVDCIDLLNESQGTNVSISNSWKKVFPEAAATGQDPDQNQGLSSDDSDDNDFDPDRPEVDEESEGDESNSEDSDFTSDELEASPGDKQQLGISSDDSEDDDYNPDAPQLDDNAKQEESSSSDFTSDFDDLAFFDSDKISGEVESCKSILQGDSIRENSFSGKEKQSPGSELLSTSKPSAGEDGSLPITARRTIGRLDYKKLYDETYGNASSDTSDEDYFDAIGPMDDTEDASGSANGKFSAIKKEQKDSKYVPKRNRQRSNSENATGVSSEAHDGSPPSSSSGKRVKSVYKRLGESATQGLYRAFKENKYPTRAAKESLAKELGISYRQVNKWFGNARWSFNHPSPMDPRPVGKKASAVPKSSNNKSLEPEHDETVGRGATSNGGAQIEESRKPNGPPMEESPKPNGPPMESRHIVLALAIAAGSKTTTPRPRKRKHSSDEQPDAPESAMLETENLPANLLDAEGQEAQAGKRVTRRKSIT